MHQSFMQLLNLTRFLTFNLIFIYSSLIFKILKTWLLHFCLRLSRLNNTCETLQAVTDNPIIGCNTTQFVRLTHPGHTSTPTLYQANTAQSTGHVLGLAHPGNPKCLRATRALHGPNPCPASAASPSRLQDRQKPCQWDAKHRERDRQPGNGGSPAQSSSNALCVHLTAF